MTVTQWKGIVELSKMSRASKTPLYGSRNQEPSRLQMERGQDDHDGQEGATELAQQVNIITDLRTCRRAMCSMLRAEKQKRANILCAGCRKKSKRTGRAGQSGGQYGKRHHGADVRAQEHHGGVGLAEPKWYGEVRAAGSRPTAIQHSMQRR